METRPQPKGGSVNDGPAVVPFADFYRAEFQLQLRRATLLLGDVEAAGDAVQDAFVEIYRRWERIESPGPYLNTAVINRCRDYARSVRRRSAQLKTLIPQATAPESHLFDRLHSLPFNQRAVLVLRYQYRFTEAETAAILGCRPGSVGPWLQRGLKTLRKESE